jgi:hypothetical protein
VHVVAHGAAAGRVAACCARAVDGSGDRVRAVSANCGACAPIGGGGCGDGGGSGVVATAFVGGGGLTRRPSCSARWHRGLQAVFCTPWRERSKYVHLAWRGRGPAHDDAVMGGVCAQAQDLLPASVVLATAAVEAACTPIDRARGLAVLGAPPRAISTVLF